MDRLKRGAVQALLEEFTARVTAIMILDYLPFTDYHALDSGHIKGWTGHLTQGTSWMQNRLFTITVPSPMVCSVWRLGPGGMVHCSRKRSFNFHVDDIQDLLEIFSGKDCGYWEQKEKHEMSYIQNLVTDDRLQLHQQDRVIEELTQVIRRFNESKVNVKTFIGKNEQCLDQFVNRLLVSEDSLSVSTTHLA
jgi:hypothetical protein